MKGILLVLLSALSAVAVGKARPSSSSASAWRSPCAVAHEREPTLPDCGPG